MECMAADGAPAAGVVDHYAIMGLPTRESEKRALSACRAERAFFTEGGKIRAAFPRGGTEADERIRQLKESHEFVQNEIARHLQEYDWERRRFVRRREAEGLHGVLVRHGRDYERKRRRITERAAAEFARNKLREYAALDVAPVAPAPSGEGQEERD